MTRRLVAVLPCRCNSTRLWAKPLQRLAPKVTICEYLVSTLKSASCIEEVRLAIAQGPGDNAFADLAEQLGLAYLVGSEEDVLGRVVACAREAGATDVLRKTSEDPFLHTAMLEPAWHCHVDHNNDVTAVDPLPEGAGFEIFTLGALARCHEKGNAEDHEHIANYARFHQADFVIEILRPEPALQRLDVRLTVDNPEDLILCRTIYRHLARDKSPIPLGAIVDFVDAHPELAASVSQFADRRPVWLDLPQRDALV
jgi:spore coat polysaccharide biosynthesis protein SpsF